MRLDYDPTYVINEVEIARDGASPLVVQDPNSQRKYFARSFSRSTYTQSGSDAKDMADYILDRYIEPHARTEQVVLTPARYPAAYVAVLSLEIGDLVTVKRRTTQGNVFSLDCYVDRIEHHFDAQTADWVTTLNLSPSISYYWVLDDTTASQLGTWSSTLVGSSSLAVVSGVRYYTFPVDLRGGSTNTLEADVAIGQQFYVRDVTYVPYLFAVTSIGAFTDAQVQPITGCTITLYNNTLAASITPDATTVTGSSTFPAGLTAILIDLEWMSILSGAGTSTLTVRRGTPQAGVYDPTSVASHAASTSIAYRVDGAGFAGAVDGTPITDSYSNYAGTTKLGY